VTDQQAAAALDAADGHTRTALVSLLADADVDTSRASLSRAQGRVREAVAALARARDDR
jgi:N-acetylmuramic acid 6-phosphate etherase